MIAADPFAPLPGKGNGAARGQRGKDDAPFEPLPAPPGSVPPDRYQKLGPVTKRWAYHAADGELLGFVARFDGTNGARSKEFRPERHGKFRGRTGWHLKGWTGERTPLYRWPTLVAEPESAIYDGRPTVLVCEGEKAADAAADLFPKLVATTPMHGAQSPQKADWAPVKDRHVVIWPDHDDAGGAFAEQVARLATEAGAASVRVVAVPDTFPEKWDLADALPEGATPDTLHHHVACAQPWTPKPAAEAKAEALEKAGEHQRGFLVSSVWTKDAAGNNQPPGVYRRVVKKDEETGEKVETWSWFCSLLEIAADTRNASGEQWGRLIVLTDRDGRKHEWAMPMSMLAGDGATYREILLSFGLELAPGRFGCNCLHEYLMLWRPQARARCVDRTGWHGPVFVLPDATYGSSIDDSVILQTAGNAPSYEVLGTLDGWKEGIARLAVGNHRLALLIATALAAPALHLIGDESGGIHLAGGSSTGKTTALHCAASVWGCAVNSWRTTDNAGEGLARGASDALLCLDEISQADGRAVDAIAYMLGNGTGKARMRRDASARPVITWRILFASTGELGLGAKMQEVGRRARAGQEVRVVEIPVDAGKGLGIFENLYEFSTADALARHLRLTSDHHKGHAARAFLAAIAADPRGDRPSTLGDPAGVDAGTPAGRSRRTGFAGGTAVWPDCGGRRAGDRAGHSTVARRRGAPRRRSLLRRLAARGGSGPAEIRDGIAQVRAFLEAHGSSRFEPAWPRESYPGSNVSDETADAIRKTINRAGFRRIEDEGRGDRWEFYVLPGAWKDEVCRGYDASMIAREMLARGWLRGDTGGRTTRKPRVPGHGPQRVYIVAANFMEQHGDGGTEAAQ